MLSGSEDRLRCGEFDMSCYENVICRNAGCFAWAVWFLGSY